MVNKFYILKSMIVMQDRWLITVMMGAPWEDLKDQITDRLSWRKSV